MRARYLRFKSKTIALRRLGKTYGEIRKIVNQPIPKSTISEWCKNVTLPGEYKTRLKQIIKQNIQRGRVVALAVNRTRREKYIQSVRDRIVHLRHRLEDKDVAKIALAMLYLAEGSKTQRGFLVFGNSAPLVISLFLYLLRYCYILDEKKFRCTLQCRADQDTKDLERFWSGVTGISPSQFYKARIDPRTLGRPSKKPDYKGVCRIDYFSGDIFAELKQIAEVLSAGL